MIREPLIKQGFGKTPKFRWRGEAVSRLEGLSDAVFGFALTLLVVSLEVPKTFKELQAAMWGFVPFAACFAIICLVWYRHFIFHRRYGLEDIWTTVLNFALLFVVLFYVYPLKFVFNLVTKISSDGLPTAINASGKQIPVIEGNQIGSLFIIYGVGYAAIYFVFTLLYFNAYRKRTELELTICEKIDTQESIVSNLSMMTVGILSTLLAGTLPPQKMALCGLSFFLIMPAEFVIGSYFGKKKRLSAAG